MILISIAAARANRPSGLNHVSHHQQLPTICSLIFLGLDTRGPIMQVRASDA